MPKTSINSFDHLTDFFKDEITNFSKRTLLRLHRTKCRACTADELVDDLKNSKTVFFFLT